MAYHNNNTLTIWQIHFPWKDLYYANSMPTAQGGIIELAIEHPNFNSVLFVSGVYKVAYCAVIQIGGKLL